jgi:hypothetical protein
VAGQPVLGVVREQPQHHPQAAAPGAQQRDLRVGAMTLAASLAGMASRAAPAAASARSARLIFFWAARISLVFLAAVVMAGSASMTARSSRAAVSAVSAFRTAVFAVLRAGLSTTFVLVSMAAM